MSLWDRLTGGGRTRDGEDDQAPAPTFALVPPPPDASFHCVGNDCIQPIKLEDALYGCRECNPRPLGSLEEEVRAQLGAGSLHRIWAQHLRCPHHGHDILPHCPRSGCHRPLTESAWGWPITVFGGGGTGKTVFTAVASHLIEKELHNLTGLSVLPMAPDLDRYRRDAVLPLMNDGVLPIKTDLEVQNKLVLQVRGPGWSQRLLLMSDMAGEVWTREHAAVGEGGAGVTKQIGVAEQFKATILTSREAIFLLDPSAPEGLKGGLAVKDHLPLVMKLLDMVQRQRLFEKASRNTLKRLAKRLQELLAASEYPATRRLAHLAEQLAGEVAGVLGEVIPEYFADEIEAYLRDWAKQRYSERNFRQDIRDFINYLEQNNFRRNQNTRFDLRIAVVVAKSDLLSAGTIPDSREILGRHNLRLEQADRPQRTAAQSWRVALDELSEKNGAMLKHLAGHDFVDLVERHFSQVGYFFSTALGRPAGIQFNRELVTVDAPRANDRFGGAAPAGPARKEVRWTMERVLLPSDAKHDDPQPDDARQDGPQPDNVLLPFLWLLAHGARS